MEPATWQPPTRMSSHVFTLDRDALIDLPEQDILSEIQAKLAAEGERLLRLLPDPPHGHRWEGDVQLMEEVGFSQEIRARLVYRLVRDSRQNSWR